MKIIETLQNGYVKVPFCVTKFVGHATAAFLGVLISLRAIELETCYVIQAKSDFIEAKSFITRRQQDAAIATLIEQQIIVTTFRSGPKQTRHIVVSKEWKSIVDKWQLAYESDLQAKFGSLETHEKEAIEDFEKAMLTDTLYESYTRECTNRTVASVRFVHSRVYDSYSVDNKEDKKDNHKENIKGQAPDFLNSPIKSNQDLMAQFDEVRKAYPKRTRGLGVEWSEFIKNCNDYATIVPILKGAIQKKVNQDREGLEKDVRYFSPAFPDFVRYLKKREFEKFLDTPESEAVQEQTFEQKRDAIFASKMTEEQKSDAYRRLRDQK